MLIKAGQECIRQSLTGLGKSEVFKNDQVLRSAKLCPVGLELGRVLVKKMREVTRFGKWKRFQQSKVR